ncbi:MAG: phosphoenolpyruvate--protein phosphotransferase, partial [Planctomycetota bacterium]
RALERVSDEIGENEQIAVDRLGAQYGAIFAAHAQLARDESFREEVRAYIRRKNYSPEFASSRVIRKYAKALQEMGNPQMAERAADLFDLEKRVLRELLGQGRDELKNLTDPVVLLAKNLTPSETASLDRSKILAFVTEGGGRTSHTAILAGALELPAVVGVGRFLSDVSGGETVIVDGQRGELLIDPDEETLAAYRRRAEARRTESIRLQTYRDVQPRTRDGERVFVMGNIEFPEEVGHCTDRGSDGVGLYRTEFLYLQSDAEPTEEEHFQAYCKVVTAMAGRPVVIRTMDLGADKVADSMRRGVAGHLDSALGLRSIRLSLQNLPSFKTQLRAVLRASVCGDVRVMFPLVSTLLELRQAKMVLADVMEDLEEEGIDFRRDIPVGMMVEVPSAALRADDFAREVDFFSIGTNDLIQYTLAADRADPDLATLYSASDPSVLRLIRLVVEAASRHDVPVTVCGQMSSDPKFLPLLLGLGIRQISVTPHMIPELKDLAGRLDLPTCEAVAAHADTLELARDVENYLRDEVERIRSGRPDPDDRVAYVSPKTAPRSENWAGAAR